MNNKKARPEGEIPKHKKKVIPKTHVKSDHKHKYETALLYYDDKAIAYPTKVCIICGRIGYVDTSSLFYEQQLSAMPWVEEKPLSKEALNLPKWRAENYLDKFALKIDP